MKKTKVSKLNGAWLDYWVARAEGYRMVKIGYVGCESETEDQKDLPAWFWESTDHSVGCYWVRNRDRKVMDAIDHEGDYETPYGSPFNPSGKWAHGGPIIEREKIVLHFGRTPVLLAAMRAYVASKFGSEVSSS